MRLVGFGTVLVLVLTGGATVMAADLVTTSRIETVTVFPQGAEIARVATAKLAAGEHVVTLRDLPMRLSPDSVRVEGTSTGQLQIGAVDVRAFQLTELSDPAALASERLKLQEQLDQLNDQRRGLDATIQAASTQRQLIQNLVNLPNRPVAPGGVAAADPDWGQIYTVIGERLVAAEKVILVTSVEMRGLDKRIADVQAKLDQQPQSDDGRTEVKVRVSAAAAADATFVVRYQVDQANWQPIYDARLAIGDAAAAPALVLQRNAIIAQSSGEAWNEVTLSLSTTRPQAGTVAPDLLPLSVDIAAPPPPPAPTPSGALMRKRNTVETGEDNAAELGQDGQVAMSLPVPEAAPAPMTVQPAQIANGAFQAVYSIAGKQTVASGVGDKRVQIDAQTIAPSLTLRSVPKIDPVAYLYAKWQLPPELSILPGIVALFRDGIYVGRGNLPLLAGGEEHELGFGADDKVRVKYSNLGAKAGQTGLISKSKTDTQSFRITAKNLHDRAVTLRILDQLPVSANDEIKVVMASDATVPTVTDVDDKRGVLAWDLPLTPGQEAVIALGYQVSWPTGKNLTYSARGQY